MTTPVAVINVVSTVHDSYSAGLRVALGASHLSRSDLGRAPGQPVIDLLWGFSTDDGVLPRPRPWLVVEVRPSEDTVRSWLRMGARGVVPQDADLDAIRAAAQSAAGGLAVLPSGCAPALADRLERPPALNERDRLVLSSLAGGTLRDLARETGYSERQATRLVAQLLAKLGMSDRREAVAAAARWGL